MIVKCVCLDDSNKPKEIPDHLWVVQGTEYHIICVYWHPRQGVQGVDLLEIALDDNCYPFETYQLRRFGFTQKEMEQLRELAMLCNELDEVDVDALMEECTPQQIHEEIG